MFKIDQVILMPFIGIVNFTQRHLGLSNFTLAKCCLLGAYVSIVALGWTTGTDTVGHDIGYSLVMAAIIALLWVFHVLPYERDYDDSLRCANRAIVGCVLQRNAMLIAFTVIMLTDLFDPSRNTPITIKLYVAFLACASYFTSYVPKLPDRALRKLLKQSMKEHFFSAPK